MTKEQKDEIIQACEYALRLGYRIEADTWGVSWDSGQQQWCSDDGACCPLGAVLLTRDIYASGTFGASEEASVAKALGVTELEVGSFLLAVDGEAPAST